MAAINKTVSTANEIGEALDFALHRGGVSWNGNLELHHPAVEQSNQIKSVFPTDGSLFKMLYLAKSDIAEKEDGVAAGPEHAPCPDCKKQAFFQPISKNDFAPNVFEEYM